MKFRKLHQFVERKKKGLCVDKKGYPSSGEKKKDCQSTYELENLKHCAVTHASFPFLCLLTPSVTTLRRLYVDNEEHTHTYCTASHPKLCDK